ncbi:GntR family transcriptional regulator [Actinocorallia populi]|uniref:GntR family transcriptional regulator n=1 Tax=Actinocorallia populi TaxID=2079200 RepID=UPI0018E5A5BE|nr:GntR family transcriptional regulator [Actinocorallia populi]
MARHAKWREVAEDLRRRIEAGEFNVKTGRAQLPKELDLQGHYDASRNTVRDALRWLADQRVVETEAGKGTFVLFRPEPFHVTLSARRLIPGEENEITVPGGGEGVDYSKDASVQGRVPFDTEPRVEVQFASGQVAHWLGLPPESQVVLRHQTRSIEDKPWSLQTSYYPLEFVTKGAVKLLEAKDIPQGVVAYLGETDLKITQAGYHDEINVRPPNPAEADFFGLPETGSVPVYETFRTAYDQHGNAFRFTVTIWPSDRNRLHYNVGRVPPRVIDEPGQASSEG